MSAAPHSTPSSPDWPGSPNSLAHHGPEHWQIKALGWRSIFSDRLLWLAIGLSFAIHLVLLAPQYGIKIPQRGDTSLMVSFRAASQPMAHQAPVPTTRKTERSRTEPQAHVIQPSPVVTKTTTTLNPRPTTPIAKSNAPGGGAAAPGTGNRRVTLTPGMKDYRYSQYLDDWRRKVERIGAMNYPEEARGKFFGSLVLSVALRPDGNIDRIVILRSSGNPVLDEAAKRIVTFAAPFAPFPPDIRQETDYLDITRTWTFTRGNALETR